MSKSYTPLDFKKRREWVIEDGGELFGTVGSFDWFVRQHRQELVDSGELIIRRGPGGSLVGPGFGDVAIGILQREARRIADVHAV
ncbi:hypothetical protein [Thiosocius teredinicola]|uniref:hypothetical protein n=1 Tax=Thiosocius teredinicola TaxID=1973002 RepID=UPI0009911686